MSNLRPYNFVQNLKHTRLIGTIFAMLMSAGYASQTHAGPNGFVKCSSIMPMGSSKAWCIDISKPQIKNRSVSESVPARSAHKIRSSAIPLTTPKLVSRPQVKEAEVVGSVTVAESEADVVLIAPLQLVIVDASGTIGSDNGVIVTAVNLNTEALANLDESIASNTDGTTVNAEGIITNAGNIADNSDAIAINTSDIGDNRGAISQNTRTVATFSSNIAANTAAISVNASGVADNRDGISRNLNMILQNTNMIKELRSGRAALAAMPDLYLRSDESWTSSGGISAYDDGLGGIEYGFGGGVQLRLGDESSHMSFGLLGSVSGDTQAVRLQVRLGG